MLSILKTHKTPGPGSIPTRILRNVKKRFSEPASDLIKLSIVIR